MPKYVLPADISRCHDRNCPQSEECLRFQQRAINRDPRRVCAVTTFLTGDVEECEYFIPVREEDAVPEAS